MPALASLLNSFSYSYTTRTQNFPRTMLSSMQLPKLAAVVATLLATVTPTNAHKFSPATVDVTGASFWKTLNNATVEYGSNGSISITTPPATDLWRPNATSKADNFSAPYIYHSFKASQFTNISVTVSADWQTRYDQGGIAIIFPESKPYKWIKTGIEFENKAPQLGTVATYAFSDWSLSPIVPKGATSSRFTFERSTTEAWVYSVEVDVTASNGTEVAERYPLREVTWAFLEERGEEDAEIWVGLYAAKPTYSEGDSTEGLTVEFSDLEIVAC